MTILVKRLSGTSLQVLSGHHRLRAMLQVDGKATVVDAETREIMEVHEVEGQLIVLASPEEASAETIAAAAITRAAQP